MTLLFPKCCSLEAHSIICQNYNFPGGRKQGDFSGFSTSPGHVIYLHLLKTMWELMSVSFVLVALPLGGSQMERTILIVGGPSLSVVGLWKTAYITFAERRLCFHHGRFVCLSVSLLVRPYVCIFVCLSIRLSVSVSVRLSVCLCVCGPVYLYVFMCSFLAACLTVCLSVGWPVGLFCPSIDGWIDFNGILRIGMIQGTICIILRMLWTTIWIKYFLSTSVDGICAC